MEKRTFVIIGTESEPIAVINAESPQELSEKITAALIEQYDGSRPEYRHLFAPETIFNSWGSQALTVHVHDEDEAPDESRFYVDRLTIERCISF